MLSDNYPDGDPTGLSMTTLLQACRTSGIDFTFVQLRSQTDAMCKKFEQVYESAAGPENINKFELRDLRGIIQAAGGLDALTDSLASTAALSSAVTPSVISSYVTQMTGTTSYSSSPCMASYIPADVVPGGVIEHI
eukprot:gnl/MRDRNA2_/MRDRNA2_21644_c0_seq2.p1 gnl/MRDRNA2_/MRDRNA2_21644_c0~~gnl/MRDRNA2_/MRDRNA2_21644_c0_seq2.p1  ORF type:complete len:150 (-),score=22.63 gnl/MRDRNA2_/MRDRNA2_21644_c0_seq2:145-552(-)